MQRKLAATDADRHRLAVCRQGLLDEHRAQLLGHQGGRLGFGLGHYHTEFFATGRPSSISRETTTTMRCERGPRSDHPWNSRLIPGSAQASTGRLTGIGASTPTHACGDYFGAAATLDSARWSPS